MISPGRSLPFFITLSLGISKTPVSEAKTKTLSFVMVYLAGRSPFLSRIAPALTPSEKAKVTVGFDAKWTGALYSGVADISLPVYVNFSL